MDASREQITTVTVHMPASMKSELERLARATGRSQADLAVEAIGWYLEVEASQIAEVQDAIHRADAGEFAAEADVTAVREKFRPMGSSLT